MTWILIPAGLLACAASYGAGFARGAWLTWAGVQRLNAARSESQAKAADPPKWTSAEQETHSMRFVTVALSPLTKEAALRVLQAAHARFVLAPYAKAILAEQVAEQEKQREVLMLRVASTPLQPQAKAN